MWCGGQGSTRSRDSHHKSIWRPTSDERYATRFSRAVTTRDAGETTHIDIGFWQLESASQKCLAPGPTARPSRPPAVVVFHYSLHTKILGEGRRFADGISPSLQQGSINKCCRMVASSSTYLWKATQQRKTHPKHCTSKYHRITKAFQSNDLCFLFRRSVTCHLLRIAEHSLAVVALLR